MVWNSSKALHAVVVYVVKLPLSLFCTVKKRMMWEINWLEGVIHVGGLKRLPMNKFHRVLESIASKSRYVLFNTIGLLALLAV